MKNRDILNLEIVDRWYPSSKTCSQCGHIQSMPLSERVFDCSTCNWVAERDLNASFNLERAPLNVIRSARAEFTLVDKQEPSLLDEAGSRPFKSNLD